MIGEVIAIGDELTTGQRLDTNSPWIAEQLGNIGIDVVYHATVGDQLDSNLRVFREALDRSDIIITTGGLGPTADDLTRQAWAETLGVELVQDAAALEHIRSLFAKRQRPMPPANEIQAFFPAGSRVIPNPNGSAPGIAISFPRAGHPAAHAYSLPGVPAEMKEMWLQSVRPHVMELLPVRREIHHRRIKCFGVGESDLEAMLPDIIRRGRDPQVGITVSQATITLRISAAGSSREECRERMKETEDTIHRCLGEFVFGYEDDELQHVVGRELLARGLSLCTVEFGTGGLLAHWLNEVSSSLAFYRGGEVLRGIGSQSGPVTPSLLEILGRQACERFQADYCLLIGPFRDHSESFAETAQVLFTCVSRPSAQHYQLPFSGHPAILKARMAKTGLNLLRQMLFASRGT